jgi:CO dehydrogenase/acetyl-CoA synthase gamma subunit (corrinoid Fe-S protein)
MALTGLQIQKLLPKTNCKECGSNTCMAFAMKLAAKKAEIAKCPCRQYHLSIGMKSVPFMGIEKCTTHNQNETS